MEIIDKLCEASIIISLYGTIKQVSTSLEELLGYNKDELLGKI